MEATTLHAHNIHMNVVATTPKLIYGTYLSHTNMRPKVRGMQATAGHYTLRTGCIRRDYSTYVQSNT